MIFNDENEKENDNDNDDEASGNSSDLQVPPGRQQQRQPISFPPSFYCPITQDLLLEPVVAPDGLSYERKILVSQDQQENSSPCHSFPSDMVYENRALQAIMEDALELTGDTWERGIRRLQHSFRTGMQHFVMWKVATPPPASAASSSSAHPISQQQEHQQHSPQQQQPQQQELLASPSSIRHYRSLPDSFFCPITMDLMHDPVIDPDGNTFERSAIVHWIQENHTSPFSRQQLFVADLYPNQVIHDLLEWYAEEQPDHPVLQKWKSEEQEWKEHRANGTGTEGYVACIPTGNPSGLRSRRNNNNTNNNNIDEDDHYPFSSMWNADGSFNSPAAILSYQDQLILQEQRMVVCLVVGVICMMFAIIAAIFYRGYFIFVSLWIACCIRDGFRRWRDFHQASNSHRTWHQERLEETRLRIERLQQRLERLQQQEQQQQDDENYARNGHENSAVSREIVRDEERDLVAAGASSGGLTSQQCIRLELLEQRLSRLRLEYMDEEERRRPQQEQQDQQALQQDQLQEHDQRDEQLPMDVV